MPSLRNEPECGDRPGQLKPSLEVLGNRAVQQGALGVAGGLCFGGLGLLLHILMPTRVLVKSVR